jgi:phosphoenolpyruvate carboxylase
LKLTGRLDLPEGSRKTLKEIKEAAGSDPVYQAMSKEAKNEALAELQAHRNLKATGARASNASAAKDVVSTMAIQGREVYTFISVHCQGMYLCHPNKDASPCRAHWGACHNLHHQGSC